MKLLTHTYSITIYENGKLCWINKGWIENNEGVGTSMIRILFAFVLIALVSAECKAGQKDFIGVSWGPISGSGVTTLYGGKMFNELFGAKWFTALDSSVSDRNGDTVIIESLYGAGVVLRLPVGNSFYVKGGINYAVLGRINDSSFSGMSYDVGFDYQILEAYDLSLTFGKLGDINTMNAGFTITF